MGSRVTRAATHLPLEEVNARMQREQRLWCRKRWEIISQALTAPRKAEDIARTVGVSPTTIQRVVALYKQGGVAAIETYEKGGRRRKSPHTGARTRLSPAVRSTRRSRRNRDGRRDPSGS